ncbi:MAG: Fic family protein [Paludibacter sp.]|nr:Fic family protein [Paludibacter sp.]
MDYFWQHSEFPNFHFKIEEHINDFQEFATQLGEVNGLFVNVSETNKQEIILQVILSEALKTSEIEGEYFSREDIMSSLQKQLGIADYVTLSKDKRANAISELMLQVRNDYQNPLTLQMLRQWHQTLMKFDKIVHEGEWRASENPMQIISGRAGKIEIHFEAPPSKDLPRLLIDFEKWYQCFPYQEIGQIGRAMLRAALVHLYFETLHPFEDGNGRIGRALAEKALAETLQKPVIISISKKIEENKKEYYETLKRAQRTQEVSNWLHYFFNILIEAQKEVEETVLYVIEKALYFDRFKKQLNERQLKAIEKMTENGKDSFEGGMTAKKYIGITKTSKATATRDLQLLFEIGAFIREGEGRSVKYKVNWE